MSLSFWKAFRCWTAMRIKLVLDQYLPLSISCWIFHHKSTTTIELLVISRSNMATLLLYTLTYWIIDNPFRCRPHEYSSFLFHHEINPGVLQKEKILSKHFGEENNVLLSSKCYYNIIYCQKNLSSHLLIKRWNNITKSFKNRPIFMADYFGGVNVSSAGSSN